MHSHEILSEVDSNDLKVGGREQLAIEAYAEALEAIPLTIAQNSGLHPIDIMVELRSKHANPENKWFGVQVKTGKIADMLKDNIMLKSTDVKAIEDERKFGLWLPHQRILNDLEVRLRAK